MIYARIKRSDSSYCNENAKRCAEIIKLICKNEPSVCAYVDAILQKKNPRSVASSLCALELLLELCTEHGIAPSTLSIAKDETGRPYFPSHPHVDFNISHTNAYVAVAVATKKDERVGVDIEDTARFEQHPDSPKKLAKRFFCDSELDVFSDFGESTEKFVELWTRKEAYLKYTGEGISKISSSDTFSNVPSNISFISDRVGLVSGGTYFTLCYSPSASEPHVEIFA